MITNSDVTVFAQKIYKWNCFGIDKQEVISVALERFANKEKVAEVLNPVRWLLRAAKKIKLELARERLRRANIVALAVDRLSSDRRKNGVQTERPTVINFHAPVLNEPSQTDIACQSVLQTLTPLERQIAEICGIQGVSPAEAARTMSLGRSTVKSRRDRLWAKLRRNTLLIEAASSGGVGVR